MVGVYCEGGAYRAFLADENGERIIYWMRMLDADK